MLKLLSLGGNDAVTQNMYLYEYQDQILLVDCGIGFPNESMPGVDILLPDIAPLLKKIEAGSKIVGMILTHGHDDHIAATRYLLADLPKFPIFGSPLTIGFAENRVEESGVKPSFIVMKDGQEYQVGQFSFESIAVTHSVPDTKHFLIKTPEVTVYHGTDFKLDPQPVDGVVSDLDRVRQLGEVGIDLALMDCLRVEMDEPVPSESTVGPAILEQMRNVTGKVVVTMMSSHLHRIQQTIDAAEKLHRQVVFVGRSVEQNVKVAQELGLLRLDPAMMIDKYDLEDYYDYQLCIIIAGSQGQEGSSLLRAVTGEHKEIRLTKEDKVIFSAEAIPGNEVDYYGAIDELARQEIPVIYPTLDHNLHQSGHGSAPEQRQLLELLKPRYVVPIGGAARHRALFIPEVAEKVGLTARQVLNPRTGEVIGVDAQSARVVDQVQIQAQTVDGKGIGDVGRMVLSDRKAMAESGMIVLVIPRQGNDYHLRKMEVVSRGFVFMQEAEEVVKYIRERVAEIIVSFKGNLPKDVELKRRIERRLSRSLFKIIQRQPLVMTVFVEV